MKNQKTLKTKHQKTSKEVFAFCFNLFLALFEIIGLVFLFVIPLPRGDGKISTADGTTFKFFTADSNILIFLASVTYLIFIILIGKNKIGKIPVGIWVFKQISTIGVALTLAVTVLLLTPGAIMIKKYPVGSLYSGSNLFFHLICPLISIVTFLLFENEKNISIKHTFGSFGPILIYGAFYLSLAYCNMNKDGTFPEGYDGYKFCSFGIVPTIFIMIGLLGMNYLFSGLLGLGNRKIDVFDQKRKRSK